MEPLNDNELRDLLRQWEAPRAPAHLERRIFGEPRARPWYRWLWNGSVRVPVPVFALLLLAAVFAALSVRSRARHSEPAFAREVKLSEFQPVAAVKPRIVRRVYENN